MYIRDMRLRVARHTASLEKIIEFYQDVLGFRQLGSFKDRHGYDGVFLGIPGENWHLAYTVSADPPVHETDEDDFLVLYPESKEVFARMLSKARKAGTTEVKARNPFWNENAVNLLDPDGFRLVLVMVQ